VEELDGILDRDDVHLSVLVDVVDHGGKCRRLARSGHPGHQNQTARPQGNLLQDSREIELPYGLHLVRNGAKGKRQGSPLLVDVGPEAADAGNADSEVRFLLLGEFLHLPGGHDLFGQQLEVFGFDRRHLQTLELAV
jgi:hypothetical protein